MLRCSRSTIFAVLLIAMSLGGCAEEVVHDLSEESAGRVVVQLQASGIEARKDRDRDRWKVAVSSRELTRALRIVERMRLIEASPAPKEGSRGLFAGSRERESHALELRARELEHSLRRLPGVYEAHVHLSVPPGKEQVSLESAAVLLLHFPETPVDVGGVRAIVSGATGLAQPSIAVVTIHAGREPAAALRRPAWVESAANVSLVLGMSAVLLRFGGRRHGR